MICYCKGCKTTKLPSTFKHFLLLFRGIVCPVAVYRFHVGIPSSCMLDPVQCRFICAICFCLSWNSLVSFSCLIGSAVFGVRWKTVICLTMGANIPNNLHPTWTDTNNGDPFILQVYFLLWPVCGMKIGSFKCLSMFLNVGVYGLAANPRAAIKTRQRVTDPRK